MGKFNFKIINIQNIYSSLVCLKKDSNCFIKEINLISDEKSTFISPIEGIHINIAVNQINHNKVSVLGIIKKDLSHNKELYYECDTKEFSIRNIENYGVYVFAGRPDLEINKDFTPFLDLNQEEIFINKLKSFEKLIESAINEIYKNNNIKLPENIDYSFTIESENKIQPDKKASPSNEIPEALKRLYQKIGN